MKNYISVSGDAATGIDNIGGSARFNAHIEVDSQNVHEPRTTRKVKHIRKILGFIKC